MHCEDLDILVQLKNEDVYKCVNIASSILALTTMEEAKDEKVLVNILGTGYWFSKETADKINEWMRKQEIELAKRWLTLTKK
nr:MAG TPA: hypothetical protein [Caudoviricetes sp.]